MCVVLSTTIRTLDALEMGGRERPRTRCMKEDLPTPAPPMMAMLKVSMLEGEDGVSDYKSRMGHGNQYF